MKDELSKSSTMVFFDLFRQSLDTPINTGLDIGKGQDVVGKGIQVPGVFFQEFPGHG